MVGRRHARASARSGPGHPSGRLRLAAVIGRNQSALPPSLDPAPPMIHLNVMVFPGVQTLPLFAAQERGFFASRGLAVELKPAPNSQEQREGLAAGRYPIAHGAADQCVALADASKVDAI